MLQRNIMISGISGLDSRWLPPAYFMVLLLVFFSAAHNVNMAPGSAPLLLPVYWLVRLSVEFVLFVGTLFILESSLLHGQSSDRRWLRWPLLAVLTCLLTIVPFVMIVTMLDIAMGLPELDGVALNEQNSGMMQQLLLEVLYLSDNHIIFSVLIIFPRVLIESYGLSDAKKFAGTQADFIPPFMAHIKPPLRGDIESIEAQEHYIRIQTNSGSGTVLYRFRDALRELKEYDGLQVHRSYWVADAAVNSIEKANRSTRIILKNGSIIPVSRRFEIAALERFSSVQLEKH